MIVSKIKYSIINFFITAFLSCNPYFATIHLMSIYKNATLPQPLPHKLQASNTTSLHIHKSTSKHPLDIIHISTTQRV